MSKMAELDLDRQVLHEHLHFISLGAEIASRRARALPFKPPFTTSAQDELIDAEKALEEALQQIRVAMQEYDRKPEMV